MYTATDIVLAEGLGEAGLPVCLRMGDDPGRERMSKLIGALERLSHDLRGRPVLDRRLASALHGLSFHVAGTIEAWEIQGKAFDPALTENELPHVFDLIDEIHGDPA